MAREKVVLSLEERTELEQAVLNGGKVGLRAQAVLNRMEGLSYRQIAQKLGVSTNSIIGWTSCYWDMGLAGLAESVKPKTRLRVLFDEDGLIRNEIRRRVREKTILMEAHRAKPYTYAELSALTGLGAEAIFPLFRENEAMRPPAFTVCLRAAKALNVPVSDLFVWEKPSENSS